MLNARLNLTAAHKKWVILFYHLSFIIFYLFFIFYHFLFFIIYDEAALLLHAGMPSMMVACQGGFQMMRGATCGP